MDSSETWGGHSSQVGDTLKSSWGLEERQAGPTRSLQSTQQLTTVLLPTLSLPAIYTEGLGSLVDVWHPDGAVNRALEAVNLRDCPSFPSALL